VAHKQVGVERCPEQRSGSHKDPKGAVSVVQTQATCFIQALLFAVVVTSVRNTGRIPYEESFIRHRGYSVPRGPFEVDDFHLIGYRV
jgi:hypothetical protein